MKIPDLRLHTEERPSRSLTDRFHEGRYIGSVVQNILPLTTEDDVPAALDRFQDRTLTALPVVDGARIPVGILHKTKLLSRLGQKYGFALFGAKPVTEVMESPLIFETSAPLEDVALKVVAREENSIYDAVVVVEGGRYTGTVQVHQILSKITEQNLQRMREEACNNVALLQLETRLRLAHGVQEVCQSATALVPQLLPGFCICLWKWDAERQTLRPAPHAHPPSEGLCSGCCADTPHNVRSDALDRVLRTRQPLVLADPAGGASNDAVRYFLLTPLIAGNASLGVMYVCRAKGSLISDQDVELSQELAGQIALALHEEQAREDLERQVSHISLLNRITRAVIERLDTESLFRVVFQQVEDSMLADFTGVALYQPDADTLKVLAGGPKSRSLAAEMGMEAGAQIPLDQTSPWWPVIVEEDSHVCR